MQTAKPMPEGIGCFLIQAESYFKPATNSPIAFAWSSLTPAIGLACGPFNPPLVSHVGGVRHCP